LNNKIIYRKPGIAGVKEEVKQVFAGQRSAKVGTELANNLPLDLQAAIRLLSNVEKLSAEVGNLMSKDKIEDISRKIESWISEIKELLNPQTELEMRVFEEDAEGLNRFVYGTQKTPFLGRKEEMEELEKFLADEKSFCWGIVTGEGGLGKSRLALELCLRNGNVWRAGFLPSWCSPGDYKNWVPNQPTLIIADYAASRAIVIGDIVRMMKTHADYGKVKVPYPVRLLLLERNIKRYYEGTEYDTDPCEEKWFEDFLGAGNADQQMVISTWYAKKPMRLGSLDSDDTWKIICTFGKEKAREKGRDQILEELKKIDSLCRPLYASMLGDAIGAGRSHRQWDKRAILRDALEREKKKFWEPAGVTEEDKDVLALATMAGDIDTESVSLPTEIEEMIKNESFSPERYPLMAAGSTNTVLKPLEPDILGEAFVLELLRPKNSRQTERVDRIREMAWSLNREKMTSFLFRVANDFPKHPTLKYLLRL
jgi:hypothetical protein